MPIVVRIDVELAKRKMSVGEFADRVGLTPANVAVCGCAGSNTPRPSAAESPPSQNVITRFWPSGLNSRSKKSVSRIGFPQRIAAG